jgi:hypothetical protein
MASQVMPVLTGIDKRIFIPAATMWRRHTLPVAWQTGGESHDSSIPQGRKRRHGDRIRAHRAALVAVAIIAAVGALGTSLGGMFDGVRTKVTAKIPT